MAELKPVKRPAGRPVGSKSKSTVKQAIKLFESNQMDAAKAIVAIMQGDESFFGGKEIRVAERMSAAKYVITAPSQMKEMNGKKSPKAEDSEENEQDDEVKPLITLVNNK